MTSASHTESFLSALSEALELDPSSLTPISDFSHLQWDSLAVISAIALIDEHFGVMVSGQAISECEGIPDLLNLINSHNLD